MRFPKRQYVRNLTHKLIREGAIRRRWVCRRCRVRGKMQVHHKRYYGVRPEFAIEFLCPGCHVAWHRRRDRTMSFDVFLAAC